MAIEQARSTRRNVIHTALAMLLAAIVILPLLGHNRLTDWDEGVYAGISRAMLSGHWVIPLWNTQPCLEKPPLEFWLTALSFKLFGVSEFTARLVSALSGIALVGVTHAWLTLRRNAFTAWISSVFLLGTFGFLHAARVGETDVLLSLGCILSIIGLAELARETTVQTGHAWYLFFGGFAIALMTKGAASVTLLLTLIGLITLQPALLRRFRLHFVLALILFLAAVLPWHLYMLHRFGHVFLASYIGLHVVVRATSQLEGHLTHWWFYLRVLLLSAAPFVLVYPLAILAAFRKPSLRPVRVFALFALITLLLFTIVQTRLPHYILPMYPALCILSAAWIADRLPVPSRNVVMRFAVTAVAAYVLAAWLTSVPRKSLHSPRLPNGVVVPDNREQVALLKQAFREPQVEAVPGTLLSWRTGTYNPIPSTVFYANRRVQQVVLVPTPTNLPTDKYFNDPVPLTSAVSTQPGLILLDRSLLAQLPPNLIFQPLATSPNLAIGTMAARRH
jgi:4-amino-4-deoxy-L-arabinose transferase-like glycosyltransferase